jgi:hypothetical protein
MEESDTKIIEIQFFDLGVEKGWGWIKVLYCVKYPAKNLIETVTIFVRLPIKNLDFHNCLS